MDATFDKKIILTGNMDYIEDYYDLDRMEKSHKIHSKLSEFNLEIKKDYSIQLGVGCFNIWYSDDIIMNPFKLFHEKSLIDSVDTRYLSYRIGGPSTAFKYMVEVFQPPTNLGIIYKGTSSIFRNVVYYDFESESAKLEFIMKNAKNIINQFDEIKKGVTAVYID